MIPYEDWTAALILYTSYRYKEAVLELARCNNLPFGKGCEGYSIERTKNRKITEKDKIYCANNYGWEKEDR